MKLVLLLASFVVFGFFESQAQVAFRLRIPNLKSTAVLRIAFYKKEDTFLDENKFTFAKEIKPTKIGEALFVFLDIPAGEYALAVYQDLNNNKKLDTNLINYPKEPFGFSQNIKPKFFAPTFEACKVIFDANNTIFTIKLIN